MTDRLLNSKAIRIRLIIGSVVRFAALVVVVVEATRTTLPAGIAVLLWAVTALLALTVIVPVAAPNALWR